MEHAVIIQGIVGLPRTDDPSKRANFTFFLFKIGFRLMWNMVPN